MVSDALLRFHIVERSWAARALIVPGHARPAQKGSEVTILLILRLLQRVVLLLLLLARTDATSSQIFAEGQDVLIVAR